METCKRCGGAIPEPGHRYKALHEIRGQAVAKRAIEIALAGGHSLGFVHGLNSFSDELVHWCREQGIPIYAHAACPCGAYGDPYTECTCSISSIRRHQALVRRRVVLDADITVELERVPTNDLLFKGLLEHETGMLERVARSKGCSRPGDDLTQDCTNLLKAAIDRLGLRADRIEVIKKVAATIARLEGVTTVSAAHIAEAIQYNSL